MVTGRHGRLTRLGASMALAVAVGAGCSTAEPSEPAQQRDRVSTPDAPDTGGHGKDSAANADGVGPDRSTDADASAAIAAALAARATADPQSFVLLVDDARAACVNPTARNRLDELAVLAERWADAVADGRPKVQAVTERQLSAADWEGLAEACTNA